MEKRRFGRTGHDSTVAIFGAAALSEVSQAETDRAVEQIMAAGVNHIDVAPSYGRAEELLGPWMPRIRDDFFLGCKTMERTREGAAAELRRSLERLRVDRFDLYQLHAVTNMEELDEAMGPGGALEAAIEAREEGLTDYIGITGHGVESPAVFLEALRRFDFDTVLFPINFVQYANPAFRESAEELLTLCRERDVGTMIIKAITRGPWNDRPKRYDTWYEPFDDMEMVQQGIDFALSQDVTGICTAGDVRLLPLCLQACENHRPMSREQQEELIAGAAAFEPLFA
jgi:aryl-alcohol dehydrogenase-like predicted oxidoreductase